MNDNQKHLLVMQNHVDIRLSAVSIKVLVVIKMGNCPMSLTCQQIFSKLCRVCITIISCTTHSNHTDCVLTVHPAIPCAITFTALMQHHREDCDCVSDHGQRDKWL